MIIIHDDLYARAWECDYQKPIFENDRGELDIPKSTEFTVQSNLLNDGSCTIPDTIQRTFPEVFPQTEGMHDGMDTDHDAKYTWETNLEDNNTNSIKPRDKKYDMGFNMKLNWNDDTRY